MNLKKSTVSITLATLLNVSTSQAAVIDMNYDGLFTWLDPAGGAGANTSYPYYGDPTWGYGFRTQISGALQFNTDTGNGSATVNPFEFLNAPNPPHAVISNYELQAIGNNLLLGNMNFEWNGSHITVQVVLDGSGLFAGLSTAAAGDIYDATSCTTSGACATPASNDIRNGEYPIGPVPVATSSFNTTGQTGFGTTLSQLSLGTDDGIGGSPQDNGPFEGFSYNFDMTSITVTNVSAVPVPAAAWLFGSGLLTLMSFSRRRKIES